MNNNTNMSDEGTIPKQTNLLEQIAREERLIQEYEHELQQLQALSESFLPEVSDDLLMDDSLRIILESVPYVGINSSLLQALTQKPPHNIQQAIRGFCFTKAVRQSRDIHVLKGHFMTDTSVEATIQIQIHQSSDGKTIAVKCDLDQGDHAWMSQHVCDDNLPLWIEGISNYLQFDKKRTQFLVNHDFEFERKESRVRIQLSDFLTVYWDWKWKRGEDAFRLPTSLPPSTIIQPRNLEALVNVCKGNCLNALKLLRQTLTATNHQIGSSLHEDVDSDGSSSESDALPVSASKRRLLKTPPSRTKVKKRKRKSENSDDDIDSDEDSNESDSLLMSSSKTKSLKTPPSQTPVKKQRRRSGYLDIVMAKRKKR